LAELLRSGSLGDLAAEAQRRRALTARLRAWLGDEEASHLVAASIDPDGTLVLTMDAPAWAARVRYRAAGSGVSRVRVRVSPRSG
jgi:Dna[CI] antecedent, DciA